MKNLTQAFNLVAFASLKENGEPVTAENVEVESARIERMVEYFYKSDSTEMHWEDYVSKFLIDKYRDIVYSDLYMEDYLDDVKEPRIEEVEEF